MELFVRYDLERLTKYASLTQNSARIRTHITTHYACLQFVDVNYFNYCICLVAEQIPQIVQETKAFYQHIPYRLLIEDTGDSASIHPFLKQQGYVCKGQQVLLQAPDTLRQVDKPDVLTELELVSPSTLHSFTQDYLTGFESDRTDAESVSVNFGQLLTSPAIRLYRVIVNRQPVGVAALYQEGDHFLLAGGAILPPYRHQGYHTGALISRLQYCWQHQPKSISAWAYQDSISYQNMCHLGLAPLKSYWIYEHRIS